MVSVVVAISPSVTSKGSGAKEQMGEGSTNGVIEVQPKVTFPE